MSKNTKKPLQRQRKRHVQRLRLQSKVVVVRIAVAAVKFAAPVAAAQLNLASRPIASCRFECGILNSASRIFSMSVVLPNIVSYG